MSARLQYGPESSTKPVLDVGDDAATASFCKMFNDMPPRLPGTVRLFDRNDYFSAHGPDALLISKLVYKTTNVIKYLGNSSFTFPSLSSMSALSSGSSSSGSMTTTKGLPSVTLSMQLAKVFLREALTAKQMRVEIWESGNSSGFGGKGTKLGGKWVLGKEASPGNLQQLEDLLFSSSDNLSSPLVMAIKLTTAPATAGVKSSGRTVGIAFADASARQLGVSEFLDDEMFSNTESLIIQLGVKECILIESPSTKRDRQASRKSNKSRATHDDDNGEGSSTTTAAQGKDDPEGTKLMGMIDRCGVLITEVGPANFNGDGVVSEVKKLLQESLAAIPLPEYDLKAAMSSLSALITYLDLTNTPTHHGQWRLRNHDLSQYMKLDASAVKALNLMPNPLELGGNKNMSLYGLLNHCKTAQGQRLLAMWLKQPLVNLHEIQQRLDLVEAFVDDSERRRDLQSNILKPMPDFSRITKRFNRGNASLEEVVRVYQAVSKLPYLIDMLEGVKPNNSDHIELIERIYVVPLRGHDDALSTYKQMVEETIDLDELSNHNYVLQASFDETLESLREKLIVVMEGLDAEHQRVADETGLDMDKKLHLEKHQVYGYSLRVTKAEVSKLKGHAIELSTQKSGYIYTTKHMKKLSSDYSDLQGQYEKTQRSLVQEVVAIAASYTPILEVLDQLMASLDVIVSFAHVSENAPIAYVKPTVTEMGTGDLVVTEARHPCLEVQDEISFIANDHRMLKGAGEFQIITGPNMGGKSTYIRQIGVIALMAQVGCFVPATEAKLPIFDSILARVGAGDSQLKGVSTFMAEMLETAAILKTATRNSLVIIDELGRGTSTEDGLSLAFSVAQYIATEIHCFCLFATHFHELTTLAQSVEHVRNYHVLAHVTQKGTKSTQDRDVTLLYKVEEGICDQSFGIHVAELANFPENVVRLAKRKAEELEDFGDGSESTNVFSKIPKIETDEGASLIREFFSSYQARLNAASGTSSAASAERGGADVSTAGDVVEVDQDGDVDMNGSKKNVESELSSEEQIKMIQETIDEFKERLDGNAWVRAVLESY